MRQLTSLFSGITIIINDAIMKMAYSCVIG